MTITHIFERGKILFSTYSIYNINDLSGTPLKINGKTVFSSLIEAERILAKLGNRDLYILSYLSDEHPNGLYR